MYLWQDKLSPSPSHTKLNWAPLAPLRDGNGAGFLGYPLYPVHNGTGLKFIKRVWDEYGIIFLNPGRVRVLPHLAPPRPDYI